jgi:large subunit ribosomal protein L24e
MVERRVCTFCGQEIEPGTGRMYVKKDGVVYQFCTSKCYKNLVELKRVPRRTTWTGWYTREKQVRMKGVEPEPAPNKARKVRKRAEPKKKAAEEKPEPEKAEEAEAGSGDEKGENE